MYISLLVLLFVVHYFADYSHLSTSWMLSAKRIGYPLYPIFIHAFIHASLMLAVASLYQLGNVVMLQMFLLQLLSHFVIDVLKGRMNVWYPEVANPGNKVHWYIFGFDQLLHHLVIIGMWYLAITG